MVTNPEHAKTTQDSIGSWCRVLLVLCTMLALLNGWLLYQLKTPDNIHDVLTAHEIKIVDETGNLAVHLVGNRDKAGVFLKDRQMRDRITLTHDDEQTGLFIRDDAGDSRIGIAQFAHGGGGVAVHGKALKGAAVLYYKTTGSLSFYSADGELSERFPQPARPE